MNAARFAVVCTAVTLGVLMLAGCGGGMCKPAIAIDLGEAYNTPDGMCMDQEGNIYLDCPNFNDPTYPAKLLKIDKNDHITEVCTYPEHPETKRACPLGIDLGPDGNFYVADSQGFVSDKPVNRILRVVMKDGKALRVEPVVSGGLYFANAISCNGDCVYVTESKLKPKGSPMPSGVYRFKLSELTAEKPVAVQPGGNDPHLILTFLTKNPKWEVGANGMAFDAQGNLYVCNFGDAQIIKFVLDAGGKVKSHEVFVEGHGLQSADGIKIDQKTGDIYVADFLGNAVHKVDGKTRRVTTLAKNGNSTGGDGSLDKCSEVCVRGNRIYVSNIDLPLDGNTYDKPHTISVITLPK